MLRSGGSSGGKGECDANFDLSLDSRLGPDQGNARDSERKTRCSTVGTENKGKEGGGSRGRGRIQGDTPAGEIKRVSQLAQQTGKTSAEPATRLRLIVNSATKVQHLRTHLRARSEGMWTRFLPLTEDDSILLPIELETEAKEVLADRDGCDLGCFCCC